MPPLNDAGRRRLLVWSALLCAIPLCLAPLAGRSSFELASEQAAFAARFSAPQLQSLWNETPVSVARDPFVAEAAGSPAGKGSEGAESVVGLHVTQGQTIGFALPPNRGAAGTPLELGPPGVIVTAIVIGPSPRALIDDGEHVRVVAVGDELGGSRISAIDASGVRLQSGTLLALTEGHL